MCLLSFGMDTKFPQISSRLESAVCSRRQERRPPTEPRGPTADASSQAPTPTSPAGDSLVAGEAPGQGSTHWLNAPVISTAATNTTASTGQRRDRGLCAGRIRRLKRTVLFTFRRLEGGLEGGGFKGVTWLGD